MHVDCMVDQEQAQQGVRGILVRGKMMIKCSGLYSRLLELHACFSNSEIFLTFNHLQLTLCFHENLWEKHGIGLIMSDAWMWSIVEHKLLSGSKGGIHGGKGLYRNRHRERRQHRAPETEGGSSSWGFSSASLLTNRREIISETCWLWSKWKRLKQKWVHGGKRVEKLGILKKIPKQENLKLDQMTEKIQIYISVLLCDLEAEI